MKLLLLQVRYLHGIVIVLYALLRIMQLRKHVLKLTPSIKSPPQNFYWLMENPCMHYESVVSSMHTASYEKSVHDCL